MVFHTIKLNGLNIGIEIPSEMDFEQFNGLIERFIEIRKKFPRSGLFETKLPRMLNNENFSIGLVEKENSVDKLNSDFEVPTIIEPQFPDSPEQSARSDEELVEGLFSRPMMIRLLKDYWADTLDESERRIKGTIRDFDLPIKTREDVRLMVFKAITKYKILPEEVDLTAFPTPGNNDIKYLRKKKE